MRVTTFRAGLLGRALGFMASPRDVAARGFVDCVPIKGDNDLATGNTYSAEFDGNILTTLVIGNKDFGSHSLDFRPFAEGSSAHAESYPSDTDGHEHNSIFMLYHSLGGSRMKLDQWIWQEGTTAAAHSAVTFACRPVRAP
jgi:hypothetical protein